MRWAVAVPERRGGGLARGIAGGGVGGTDRGAALERLRGTPRMAELAGVGLVFEAVTGDLAVRKALFVELDGVCRAEAVLTTTISGLSVVERVAGMRRLGDVVGMHFFNPVPAMPGFAPTPLLEQFVAVGYLGRDTGCGFRIYD